MIIEEIKAVIKINTVDMFRFHLTCAYFRKKGIFSIIFSLLCLIMSTISFAVHDSLSGSLFLLGALLYTILVPGYLLYKSYMVINKNSSKDKEMFYTINNDKVIVTASGKEVMISWESISRVIETNSQFIVFINKIQGYIIPKRFLNTTIEPLQSLIVDKLEADHFKDYKINLNKIKSIKIKKIDFNKLRSKFSFKKIKSKLQSIKMPNINKLFSNKRNGKDNNKKIESKNVGQKKIDKKITDKKITDKKKVNANKTDANNFESKKANAKKAASKKVEGKKTNTKKVDIK